MDSQRLQDIYAKEGSSPTPEEIDAMVEMIWDLQDRLKAKPEKFEVKMDDQGNVIIPLSDYLREVSPEVKEELAKDDYWAFPLWHKIVDTIATEYASENFNGSIDKIRTRLLTSDMMPPLVREWARGKISDLNFAQQKAQWYMNWAFALYHWADKFSPEDRRDMPRQAEYKSSYVDQKVVDACVAEFNALGVTFPDPEKTDAE